MFVEGDRDSMQLLETELWIPDGGTIQYGSEFLLVLLMSEIAIGPVSMSVDTCVFAISKKSSVQLNGFSTCLATTLLRVCWKIFHFLL